jgi:hypothetical protein
MEEKVIRWTKVADVEGEDKKNYKESVKRPKEFGSREVERSTFMECENKKPMNTRQGKEEAFLLTV